MSHSHCLWQLYRDIAITDFMSRPGITADQRDAMAVAMQHSVEMQKEVYDRRTVSDKGKSGSALVAQLFQEDMAADSADDSDTEEDLISDLE